MIESVDEIINNEDVTCGLLEGYSCYEMDLLMEAITSSSSVGSMDDDQLQAAIAASAQKSNNGQLNPQTQSEIENTADDEQIKQQNKKAAEDLNLKVGQQVDTVNPQTSEKEQSELTGVDKDKGLAFLKNKTGQIDIEPATKVQVRA